MFDQLGAQRARADADPDRVRIAVTDSGTGIEPKLLAHIFEPFTQGASIAGRRDGLGLGLYIVRGLVDAMRGTIEAESTAGEGATSRWRAAHASKSAGGSATTSIDISACS